MSYFESYRRSVASVLLLFFVLVGANTIGLYYVLENYTNLDHWMVIVVLSSWSLIVTIISSIVAARITTSLSKVVWQAIIHVSPNSNGPAPTLTSLHLGKKLAQQSIEQIYTLASNQTTTTRIGVNQPVVQISDIAQAMQIFISSLPMAQAVIDKQGIITHVNQAFYRYVANPAQSPIGKHFSSVLFFTFQTDDTFSEWLRQAEEQKVSDVKFWERVKSTTETDDLIQFDLAASYSKNNPYGFEIILAVFDKTVTYAAEDNNVSYIAMAVHELRTPLTVLRGYVEVIEDEITKDTSPEITSAIKKISASTQSLVGFVNNILNVSRIDSDALSLQPAETNWNETLTKIISEIQMRASLRGKTISLEATDNIPMVAADAVAVYEILNNLIENAIKYSGNSTSIIVRASTDQNGMIVTSVQDFGIGIPATVINNLFTKFYRSHRSKHVVGGNGLGLFIVRSLVNAQGGNVWVQSKEGEGSIFSFSLPAYSNLQTTNQESNGIQRHTHGWIKNHSMSRR